MPSSTVISRPLSTLPLAIVALALIFLSAVSPNSYGQFEDSAANWNPSPQNNLEFSSQTSFLPVEQAYRLSALVNAAGESSSEQRQLALHWDIADGYYLYKHQLKFELDGNPLDHQLPAGQFKYDEYFERELEVYYGSLDVAVSIPVAASAAQLIRVHSQGCADAGLCYPPQWQQLSIENGEATLMESLAPALSKPAPPANTEPNSDNRHGHYVWALLGALIGGIILNLMPCVFPVLSLKALSLARSRDNPAQQHLHGWAYTVGAIATFVIIAAIMLSLRQAGQAVGWGFQLQSPVVVALLAYLFFIMGLSLSGFIQLGGKLAGAGQSLTEGHSYRSSFFTGALATLVASPCTAPFMGGALGYAVTQPPVIALSIFAALGFGMALPFLLLTYFPSLSQKLPKPGPWMETLKQALAFPLYFTALWLLWVVGRQTSSDSVVLVVAGAVALAFAAWLWQHRPHRVWQQCAAAAIFALALWPMGQLQPSHTSNATQLQNDWQPFTQARLQQLLDQGQPTFVNLTADWCITCLANEKTALDTDKTLAAFERSGVVKLKGDWTHYNPEITQLLNQFGRNGVPLYLIYSNNNPGKPVILPQLLTEQTVIDAIRTASENTLASHSTK
ncbi:MAG: protein-disulfide reductase DsbD family protein [Cellvibrionaceae bacterium]